MTREEIIKDCSKSCPDSYQRCEIFQAKVMLEEMVSKQKTRLIIIRGLPGSGKSTLAKQYEKQGYVHFETDMFWGPRYQFDASRLKEAHEWCLGAAKKSLQARRYTVVSNTFTTQREIQPYLDAAKELGAEVQIILCQGTFGSVHNVPEVAIQRMKERFEYRLDLENK